MSIKNICYISLLMIVLISGVGIVNAADMSINLHPGWNFISIPKELSEGNNTANIFSKVPMEGHSFWKYDAQTLKWISMTQTTKLEVLDAYFIYSGTETSVPLVFKNTSTDTPPDRKMYKGWNPVGFSDITPATANDTLYSINSNWATLIGFDAVNQRYEVSIINGAFGTDRSPAREMLPTKGYWLFIMSDCELAVIGA